MFTLKCFSFKKVFKLISRKKSKSKHKMIWIILAITLSLLIIFASVIAVLSFIELILGFGGIHADNRLSFYNYNLWNKVYQSMPKEIFIITWATTIFDEIIYDSIGHLLLLVLNALQNFVLFIGSGYVLNKIFGFPAGENLNNFNFKDFKPPVLFMVVASLSVFLIIIAFIIKIIQINYQTSSGKSGHSFNSILQSLVYFLISLVFLPIVFFIINIFIDLVSNLILKNAGITDSNLAVTMMNSSYTDNGSAKYFSFDEIPSSFLKIKNYTNFSVFLLLFGTGFLIYPLIMTFGFLVIRAITIFGLYISSTAVFAVTAKDEGQTMRRWMGITFSQFVTTIFTYLAFTIYMWVCQKISDIASSLPDNVPLMGSIFTILFIGFAALIMIQLPQTLLNIFFSGSISLQEGLGGLAKIALGTSMVRTGIGTVLGSLGYANAASTIGGQGYINKYEKNPQRSIGQIWAQSSLNSQYLMATKQVKKEYKNEEKSLKELFKESGESYYKAKKESIRAQKSASFEKILDEVRKGSSIKKI